MQEWVADDKKNQLSVYIFYYILHLPLNINEAVHIGKGAHRLIRTPFQSHEIKSGMEHNQIALHIILMGCQPINAIL